MAALPRIFQGRRPLEACLEFLESSEVSKIQLDSGLSVTAYKIVSLGSKVRKKILDEMRRYALVARQVSKTYLTTWVRHQNNYFIVTIGKSPHEISGHLYGRKKPEYSFTIKVSKALTKLQTQNPGHFEAVRRLVHQIIIGFFQNKKGYSVDSLTLYDTSRNLGPLIRKELEKLAEKQRNPSLLHFADFIAIYPAYDISFAKHGGTYFLRATSLHRIMSTKTTWDLINEGLTDYDIAKLGEVLRFEAGGTAHLKEILRDLSVDIPIEEFPFDGRSYREYVEDNYHEFKNRVPDESCLLTAIPWGNVKEAWTYAAALMKPSLTFEAISNQNVELFIILRNFLQNRSANLRFGLIEDFGKALEDLSSPEELFLMFDNTPLQINTRPYCVDINQDGTFCPSVEPKQLISIFRPNYCYRDSEGRELEIERDEKYFGTLMDLMYPEVFPFAKPDEIRALALIPDGYRDYANMLCNNLIEGIPDSEKLSYRGFEETFGTKLEIERQPVPDTDPASYIKATDAAMSRTKDFDEALVFIPSKRLGVEFYSQPKIALFERLLPSQMITHEERTQRRYRTLYYKATTHEALFSIALQIAAKAGTVACALPGGVADRITTTDIIFGYDILRIPIEEREEVVQPVYGRRRPIITQLKLASPLVILDSRGAFIQNLGIYPIERDLFSEKPEEIYQMLQKVKPNFSTFIAHKDGRFSDPELNSIREWAKNYTLRGAAVSVIRGTTPRLFSRKPAMTPRKGSAIAIDKNFFILNTTGLPEQIPGLPRSITVEIHPVGDFSPNPYKIISQIYAFSELHTGALRGTRLPITTHFPNLIGRLLRKLRMPVIPNVFLLQTKYGSTPRWFY